MPIYVHRNNQRLGPFTAAEVKSQLASGALSVHDHVWWQGQDGWVPLGESSLMANGFKEIPGPAKPAPKPLTGTSSFAIGSLVCGAFSFLLWIIAALPAIVLGHLALNEIKKNPGRRGSGMAITGLVIGYIMTLLTIVIGASYILFMPQVLNVAREEELKGEAAEAAQVTNSVSQTPAPVDTATNIAPVPDSTSTSPVVTPAATNNPDQSTNSAPPTTSSPDSSTTSPMPTTNAPESNTNTAPMNP